MSHIGDRLIQLKNEVENTGNGAYFSKNNISKIVELLIADLEQDEKENGWIPVSERLPEDGTNVIASFSSGTVTELRYVANGIFHGIYEYSTKVIVAWRPLPEPYKED